MKGSRSAADCEGRADTAVRNAAAANRLLKGNGSAPRVLITDKLRSCDAAKREIMPGIEHRSHKGLNIRAENVLQPIDDVKGS